MPTPEELREAVQTRVQLSDRHRVERMLSQIAKRVNQGKPVDRSVEKLAAEVEASAAKTAARDAAAPPAELQPNLPIAEYADELKAAIDAHQVVIVCGETGSGKSTQLPKLCLQLGRGRRGLIGHTQPRRIAARSIAARLSEEMGTPLGGAVGYQVRFQDRTGDGTLVKLMTDGILLAETARDRFLSKYDTIIVDEAHERSLNIDFLLGYIKRLLPQRPDLKLIITSATLDAGRFAEHFAVAGKQVAGALRVPNAAAATPSGESQDLDAQDRPADGTRSVAATTPAPIISIPGRTFPVDIRYRPLPEGETEWLPAAADAACAALADQLGKLGDVLVFLPTERDIRELAELLRGRMQKRVQSGQVEVVPLYGRLSVEAQSKVFAETKARRVVLATNVAESSLTVPNIRTVVDPGLARISRFSARSTVQRLPIEPVSKASCDQRAGRCGRVGPGVCVRLYSEEDYESREPFTPPEILRTNLASVILQVESLKLGRIDHFPFIEPPKQQAVSAGYKTLVEIGALDGDRNLTPVGRQISKMPIDPRIGRILVAAADEGVLEEGLVIASLLEVRDPRDRPVDKKQQADEAHAALADERSDFLTLLKIWDWTKERKRTLSNSKFRKALQQNFLSFMRVREWQDVHRQLRQAAGELRGDRGEGREKSKRRGRKTRPSQLATSPSLELRADAVHRAILAGMLSNVGRKADEGREYVGPHDSRFVLWPGSVMAKRPREKGAKAKGGPKWVVGAELVETERRYARTVGPIRPEWVEPLAKHLVTVQQFEPHYSEKSAAAMVYERVLLWGLTIVPKRRARLSRFDPAAANELFIREGLVEGRYRSKGDFQQQNAALLDLIEEMRAKSRRADMLLGDEARYEFFAERVPKEISDGRSFEQWREKAEAERPDILIMRESDLLADPSFAVDAAAFPERMTVGAGTYPLQYAHTPGQDADGVTLRIPKDAAGQIDRQRLGWLVPGLLEEKVTALLKTLPKEDRRQLVPIPDTARELHRDLKFGEGDLLDQLGLLLRRRFNLYAPPEAFDTSRLPAHLQMRIEYADDAAPANGTAKPQPDDDLAAHESSGHASWTFGDLPAALTLRRGGLPVPFTPAVVDEGNSVGVKLLPDPAVATAATIRGLTRLLLLSEGERIGRQVKHFPGIERLRMLAMKFQLDPELDAQLAWHLALRCLLAKPTLPRTAAAWDERLKLARNQLGVAVQDAANWLGPAMQNADTVLRRLTKESRPAFLDTVEDLHEQWNLLVDPSFITETPAGWLPHLPRFFEAMSVRLKKLEGGGLGRDRKTTADVRPRWRELQDWCVAFPPGPNRPAALTAYRWLFEEYRVMRFAQEVGTAAEVSEKKLAEAREKAAESVRRG